MYTRRHREGEHVTFQYKKRGRQSNREGEKTDTHKHDGEKVT